MPKKKKNLGVSPSRKSIYSETIATGLAPSPVDLSMSQAPHEVNKEELFSSLSEMFSDLDPAVVYMVLSECDFRGKSRSVFANTLFHERTFAFVCVVHLGNLSN